jgi:hypothetical protein
MDIIKNTAILLVLLAPYRYARAGSPDSLFHKFKNDVLTIQQAHAGTMVWDDEASISYYSLLDSSSIEELIKYTVDTNAFIRSSIFSGLVQRNTDTNLLQRILAEHKNDTASYTTRSADLELTQTVKEHMQLSMDARKIRRGETNYKKRIENIKSRSLTGIKINGLHHGW